MESKLEGVVKAQDKVWAPPSPMPDIMSIYQAERLEAQNKIDKLEKTIADMQRNYTIAPPVPRAPEDPLQKMCDYGDLIIRRVNNGHIIRRVPSAHTMHHDVETWVVEGGMDEVAKQLTAIQATDVMRGGAGSPLEASTLTTGGSILGNTNYPSPSYKR